MTRRSKQMERLLAQLTAAERVQLSEIAPDGAALDSLLWDTAPIAQGGEIIGHRDFANRVTHVLARQGEHLLLRISALDTLWFALHTSLNWGSDRYLLLINWERRASPGEDRRALSTWSTSGPSYRNVALGLNGAPVMPDNEWDAQLRELSDRLRDGIQDASGVLKACQAVTAVLQEGGPFGEMIDGLLDGRLADCSAWLERLHREVEEMIGEIPLPGPHPETKRWLEEIFRAEVAGRWAQSQPPAARRRVYSMTTWEEEEARAAFGRRLRRLRIAQEVSLETLAWVARIDAAILAAIELGEEGVTLDQITTMAQTLQVSPAQLVED